MAVIAVIAATAATGGAAGAVAAGTLGATTTTAAGVVTLTAAGNVIAAVTSAMITTAAATATVSATNASMNAEGDIFKQTKDVGKTTWDDITSDESLRAIVIAGATAGIARGATYGIDYATNGAVTAGNAANATFSQKATSALYQSAISNATSIATQSAISSDSISESLNDQWQNILIMAVAQVGAENIGQLAHTHQINKTTQLILHAILGCGTAAGGGNDCASGVLSGTIGEFTGEQLKNNSNRISVADIGDGVQSRGYIDGSVYKGIITIPEDIRMICGFINIKSEQNLGPLGNHTGLTSPYIWNEKVKPALINK